MPIYHVTAPDGSSLQVEGDTPPTEAELDEIFQHAAQRNGPSQINGPSATAPSLSFQSPFPTRGLTPLQDIQRDFPESAARLKESNAADALRLQDMRDATARAEALRSIGGEQQARDVLGQAGILSLQNAAPKTEVTAEELQTLGLPPAIARPVAGIQQGISRIANSLFTPEGGLMLAAPEAAIPQMATIIPGMVTGGAEEIGAGLGEIAGGQTESGLARTTQGIGMVAPVAAPLIFRPKARPIQQDSRIIDIQPRTEGVPNASEIPSTESLPQSEVRTQLGEEAPLRQQGEATRAQGESQLPAQEQASVNFEVFPDTGDVFYVDSKGQRVGALKAIEGPDGSLMVENHWLDDSVRGIGIGQQGIQKLQKATGKTIISDQYPSKSAAAMWERLGANKEKVKVGDPADPEIQSRYVLRNKSSPTLESDRARYNEIEARQAELRGQDNAETAALATEKEVLKNRHGGNNPNAEAAPREMTSDELDAIIESVRNGTPLPEGIGPMSAGALDPTQKFTTRNTVEQVNKEREQRGLEPLERGPAFTNKQAVEAANRTLDENPDAPQILLDELGKSPRPLTPEESAMMALHRADVSNGYYRALKDYSEAVASGDAERQAMAGKVADLHLEQLKKIDENVSVGGAATASGRALQAIKIGIKEDMSLDMMMLKAERAKGEKLSIEEQSAISKEHDALKARVKELEDQLARHKSGESDADVGDAVKETVKEVKTRAAREKGKGKTRDLAAEQTAVLDHLKETFSEEGSIEGKAPTIRKLMELLVEREGITDRNAMIDRIHEILSKEVDPTITRQDAMDLMSGYGQVKLPSSEFPKKTVRDINAQILSVRKLLDFFQGKHPSRTGMQRDVPSQIQRDLLKMVNLAKKNFHLEGPVDAARATRSAIEAINTRLSNRIKDLKQEIATRQKIVSERTPSPYNEETVRLRKEVADLQAQRDEIFGKKELTPEQRLGIAEKAADRQIAELERQLKTGEIFSKTKQALGLTSPKLEAAKARLEELKATREFARDTIQPKPQPLDVETQRRADALDKQIASIEKQLADEAPFSKGKTPKEAATDPRVIEREKQLADLKTERQNMRDRLQPKTEKEVTFLKNYLLRLRQRAAQYSQRPGDYQKPVKPKRELPPDVVQAQVDVERAKAGFQKRLFEYEQSQRSTMKKIWDGIGKATNSFVNYRSTLDLSAPRQLLGAILAHAGRLATSPISGARLLARIPMSMYHGLKSENAAAMHAQRLMNRPNAISGADKMSGIEYTDLHADKFTKYEENAHSILDQWAQEPFRGGTIGQKIKKTIGTPIRMSNRAFIAALNDTRASLFDELLKTNFKDREPTPEDLKVLGNYVNVVTGRGKLNPQIASGASKVFWSPKLFTSRVQALTGQPIWSGKWRDSAAARTVVAKEYARMIGSGILLWQASRMFDEKDESDPRSSDYGKIVRGNTRIDPWGGHLQPFVLMARGVTGDTKGLDDEVRKNDLGTVLAGFGRSKIRPELGAIWDLYDIQKDRVKPGHPKDYAEFMKSNMGPLAWTETLDILKDRGIPEGLVIQALNVMGSGVSVYGEKDSQK